MTSGWKVVVGLIGAVGLVAVFAVAGFVFLEPEGAPCDTGELASNQLVDGQYQVRMETFETVEQAESFICHDVPELRAGGWTLGRITGERNVPLEFLVEGEGYGVVSLLYAQEASGRELTLDASPFFSTLSFFELDIPEDASQEQVDVQGSTATVYRFGINPDLAHVIWREGTLEHRAIAETGGPFALEELLGVLETLR